MTACVEVARITELKEPEGDPIMTRDRSLASLDQYIRMESAWRDNAAMALDL